MDIIDRINVIMATEEMNVAAFARKLGLVDQTIRGIVIQRRNKPGFDILSKIIETFPHVSAEWLLTGRGVMTKSRSSVQSEVDSVKTELFQYIKDKDDKIERLLLENLHLKSKLATQSGDPRDEMNTQ